MKNINNPISINVSDKNDTFEMNKVFLENLSHLYKDFKDENEKQTNKWINIEGKPNIKGENYYVDLENILYKSPITIIDGSWGQGKTYFLQELIFNCFIANKRKK